MCPCVKYISLLSTDIYESSPTIGKSLTIISTSESQLPLMQIKSSLNDSKNDLSSHKDRHENIGQGFIGQKALINFANHPAFDNIPIILETPYVDGRSLYKQEIAMIKKGIK